MQRVVPVFFTEPAPHGFATPIQTGIIINSKLRAQLAPIALASSARLASTGSLVSSAVKEAGPLARRALYQDVAERVRQQIFDRLLPPGSWVDEMKLCAEYGISRTPLREALKVLAAEGLVTMKLRRGAYVTEVSLADVTQVYHLLALLESDAAATVAQHATADQRLELAQLHAQLEKQVRQREVFFATNERFHLALLHMAGNRWAQQMVADLRQVMKLNRHHSLLKQGRLSASLDEHRALMAAIEARNPKRAAALMQAHFAGGLEAAAS
jgi:DNA-binding GntR family transcriptional regulator